MSDLQPQLSPDEAVALRCVALGFSHGVASDHIRRVEDLHLIEADKTSWRLTALGNSGLNLWAPTVDPTPTSRERVFNYEHSPPMTRAGLDPLALP